LKSAGETKSGGYGFPVVHNRKFLGLALCRFFTNGTSFDLEKLPANCSISSFHQWMLRVFAMCRVFETAPDSGLSRVFSKTRRGYHSVCTGFFQFIRFSAAPALPGQAAFCIFHSINQP
jgi:hypothetical protein